MISHMQQYNNCQIKSTFANFVLFLRLVSKNCACYHSGKIWTSKQILAEKEGVIRHPTMEKQLDDAWVDECVNGCKDRRISGWM